MSVSGAYAHGNLYADYYDHTDKLKIVGARLVEFYKTVVDRYAELGFYGIFLR